MKVLACACLAVLLASGAEAGWFGGKDKLPKPIDSPIVRPRIKETHKVKKVHHPQRYQQPGWGANWEPLFKSQDRPLRHSLVD
jgi:hypothetical protein